jgi:3-oxoacyl-[acyl-carrier protein] reductase
VPPKVSAQELQNFGAAGASVVVNYASSRAGADKVVAEIKKEGGKAIAVKADVSKAGEVKQLFEEAKRAFGKLDVLVNNAGVFRFAPLQDVTEDEFHREFNINVLGTLLATKEALNHFNGSGSVINLSSVVSTSPIPNSSVYAATKGAVDTLTVGLSRELAPRNIRVNVIAPGGVETEGTHEIGMVGSDFEKQIVAGTPLGRLGQPDDIAQVAVFLASEASAWLTGERISASGGFR